MSTNRRTTTTVQPADIIRRAIDHLAASTGCGAGVREAIQILARQYQHTRIGRPSGYYIEIRTGPEGWRHPQDWYRPDHASALVLLDDARRIWGQARLVRVMARMVTV